MRASQYKFTLDVQSTQSQVCLAATEGDTNREFYISFSDGGVPLAIEGLQSATIIFERPDGDLVEDYCDVLNDGANVLYPFKTGTCEAAGINNCQLLLIDANGKQLYSPSFSLNVAKKKIARALK